MQQDQRWVGDALTTNHHPLIEPPEPAIRHLGDAARHDLAARPTKRRRLPQTPHRDHPAPASTTNRLIASRASATQEVSPRAGQGRRPSALARWIPGHAGQRPASWRCLMQGCQCRCFGDGRPVLLLFLSKRRETQTSIFAARGCGHRASSSLDGMDSAGRPLREVGKKGGVSGRRSVAGTGSRRPFGQRRFYAR